MEIDELKDRAIKTFKTPDDKAHFQDKQIDTMCLSYDVETVYETMVIFKENNPKKNFYFFYQNHVELIEKNKKAKVYSKYKNKDVEYVIESLLDSMEYDLQKWVGNKELTTRLNRRNYKHIMRGKVSHEDLNKKLNSFTISKEGTIEIVSERNELFINQVTDILKGADKEIIRVYLINYFWGLDNWKSDILLPLTANLDNDIIIQTRNDMQRSLQIVRTEMIKAEASIKKD